MFDQYARDLIDALPKLPGLDPVACRRALSRAYLLVVEGRLSLGSGQHPEASDLSAELRRLADALESVAVFDPLHGVQVEEQTRAASAFVAAESLLLLASLYPEAAPGEDSDDPLQDARLYSSLESALLYMIGGYDVNAVAAVAEVPKFNITTPSDAHETRCRAGRRLLRRIVCLCRGIINYSKDGDVFAMPTQPTLLADLIDDTRARLYEVLVEGLDAYSAWLAGDADAYKAAIDAVNRVISATRIHLTTGVLPHGPSQFADVFHLANLLAAAMDATSRRSAVHGVPPPVDGDGELIGQFSTYIRDRARGLSEQPGRPFLWPSTNEYVARCLPGPREDAVVSMPTGSGKSFLAELAVAHALPRGWVLYLVPTNALAQQVRRDLGGALAAFKDVPVRAFIGGSEYVKLSEEEVTGQSFVGVMTPEKCALALRINPEVFSQCAFCVFDECHIINDDTRGAIADVLMAQLFHLAPNMRVLLMSAMVSNGDELAEWLASVRGESAFASRITWRPSRAARGFVFIDKDAGQAAWTALSQQVRAAKGAKTCRQDVPLGWVVGLSGPWTKDGPDDYRVARLPISASYFVKRSMKNKYTSGFDSWKNRTGQALSELFASCGMPTINFVMSSKHHAFSNAGRVTVTIPGAVVSADALPQVVKAQLAIADAELGVETALRDLLVRGIAVHTAAMLPVEQAASEWMFARGKSKLMFATGTLAQGLNLPAAAVVVSGSQLAGTARDDIDASAETVRATELILNGFGRAGRPGFANQGVVILVGDKETVAPIVSAFDVGAAVLKEYPVLGDPDASVKVTSPIENFLDQLFAADDTNEYATALELELTSLLSAFDAEEENAGAVLRRTFAGYRRRTEFTVERAVVANRRVQALKQRFLERDGVPSWMPRAAMKAGVEFFLAQRIWEAYQARGLILITISDLVSLDVRGWFDVLIEVLAHLPIDRIGDYLDENQTPTPRTKLAALAREVKATTHDTDAVPWKRPNGWESAWQDLGGVVTAFMDGKPYAEIGGMVFGVPTIEIKSGRADPKRGIPAIFKFISDVVDRAMSIDAGCFLALHECWLADEHPETPVPEALQMLPLCIRNGCNSLDVLAWYRFGFRQRVCAHALAAEYPMPPEAVTDAERASAVRKASRQWLADDPLDDKPLNMLDFARVVQLDGTSERT